MISPAKTLFDYLQRHNSVLNKMFMELSLADEFERSIELLAIRIMALGKILICGNGGSAADAQHIAAELVIRYKNDRKAIPAIALTTDTSVLTAAYNDRYSMFARQVEALGRPGDVLVAISTSGTSPNIIAAIKSAKDRGLSVIGLTGQHGFRDVHQANSNLGIDVELRVPSDSTNVIQEMHILIYHALVEELEKELKLCEPRTDSPRPL